MYDRRRQAVMWHSTITCSVMAILYVFITKQIHGLRHLSYQERLKRLNIIIFSGVKTSALRLNLVFQNCIRIC